MDHHVFRVTKKDFKNDLPEILQAMDQPSIDGINVWYASKAAAKLKLKVVFSGVGGDELFLDIAILIQYQSYLIYLRKLKQ